MFVSVVRGLGPLAEEVVFVGGSAVGLLLDDPGASQNRLTNDVDCLIETVTRQQFYAFDTKLKSRGFSPDPQGPICRYRYQGLMLDVVPVDEKVLGFANRWGAAAVEASQRIVIARDLVVRSVTAPYLLATKLEAYADRGAGDPYTSHDIEDVVIVLDGRMGVVTEVLAAQEDVRSFIAGHLRLLNKEGVDLISAHMDPAPDSRTRIFSVLEKLRRLAQ